LRKSLLFFSPGFVSSTYGGRTVLLLSAAAAAFFSLVLLGPAGVLAAAAAFFWSNFACFSAFFRSLSTISKMSQHYGYISTYAGFPYILSRF
jgi:hypothetical protein